MKGKPTLLDFFAPLISRALEIREILAERREYPQSAAEIYEEFTTEIQHAQDDATSGGKREVDIKEAAFAVVAWIDESFAPYRPWYDTAVPLQVTLFRTANAGNEFFDHLELLKPDQEEVREVYFVVLGLGFVGEMYLDVGDSSSVERMKDLHGRQLALPPTVLANLNAEHVTPQPYLTDDPPPYVAPRSLWPWILGALLALLLLLISAGLVWYFFFYDPPPDRDALQRRVDEVLAGFSCADLTAEVREDLTVRVTGHVASEADGNRLRQELVAVEDVAGLSGQVLVRQWPFCEAVEILEEFATVGDAGIVLPGAPALEPNKASGIYHENESLIVTGTGTGLYQGYLYVTYLDLDENAVQLLPNPYRTDNQLPPGQTITLGVERSQARGGDRFYTIVPPFGPNMLMAIATPEPLFDGMYPEVSKAGDFLPALRAALEGLGEAAPGREPVASYLFISSRPRE